MKCPRPTGLVLMMTLSLVCSIPLETTTTTRSTPPFGETIKKLTNQLMDVNTTTIDIVSDVRTPPKVKQQQQNKMKLKEGIENSHAGVAIPVDEDAIEMEESTKKMNFYKLERPTTNSGLSTWILLSGQGSATTRSPTTKKSVIKQNLEEHIKENVTLVANDKPNRIIKPIFKKRTPSTTTVTTPITTTTPVTTTSRVTTESTKLTKIKASVLNNAVYKKNMTSTKKPVAVTISTTEKPISTTHLAMNRNITVVNATIVSTNSTNLLAEAKEGEVDLNNNSEGKKKKTTSKRKKNKTKRRKPSDKNNNSTSISRPNKNNKQNPLGTQLYNYLAREIMPTVGVGLVGLMVTAGLASYFLYPFGAARRSYDIDRKDKGGSYYYTDDYSGGIPEEEAIGKVIAGMPSNTLFSNSYKAPTSRDTYPNTNKYRLADRRAQIRPHFYDDTLQGQDKIPVTQNEHNYKSSAFEPITYPNDEVLKYPSNMNTKFVVGNIPKEVMEEVTPAAVPEHGPRSLNLEENLAEEPSFLLKSIEVNTTEAKPNRGPAYGPRSLKIRKKRSGMSNEIDNEINSSFDKEEAPTAGYETTENERDMTTLMPSIENSSTTTIGTPTTTVSLPEKVTTFIDLIKEVIHFKARLGLQVIQNLTQSISKYISKVQARLDEHYRKYSKSKN